METLSSLKQKLAEIKDEVVRIFNRNFNKGITIFQLFLGISMFLVASQPMWVLFFMGVFLFGYFEPTNARISL